MDNEDLLDRRDPKRARKSRVLANMTPTGKEKVASAVVGNMFLRFGPETQDAIARLYLGSIRQPHFADEVKDALAPLGVQLEERRA